MLRKLIKYEFRATSGLMLTLFAAFAAVSAIVILGVAFDINEIVSRIGEKYDIIETYFQFIAALIVGVYVVLSVFMCTLMFFYGIKRFRDGLLGHQGYIMHLLPVRTSTHIIAKGAVALFWNILGVLLVIVSWFLYTSWVGNNTLTEVLKGVFEVLSAMDATSWIIASECLLYVIISGASMYLQAYASMAIGYSFNKNRLLISVAAYFCADFIVSAISGIIWIVAAFTFSDIMFGEVYGLCITMFGAMILSLAIALAYYLVADHFLSKKLNLQ